VPIPKERLFALIDASREILATSKNRDAAITTALIQHSAQLISTSQLVQQIYEALAFHQPEAPAILTIQQEHAWRITTGARNEYRKLWTQQHRAGHWAEAASGLATRGFSREEILAEFRRENNIPDPSTITLETLGLAEPLGSATITLSEDDQS